MGELDERLSVQKYFSLSTACKLNCWIAESKVSYLAKVLICLLTFFAGMLKFAPMRHRVMSLQSEYLKICHQDQLGLA